MSPGCADRRCAGSEHPRADEDAIAPGFIDTEATRKITPEKMLAGMTMQTPMRRLGTPAELCGLVLFMLSDEAGYMNGQIVAVDGGLITRL